MNVTRYGYAATQRKKAATHSRVLRAYTAAAVLAVGLVGYAAFTLALSH